jgi:predicted phage terminase large subunit-like protein
MAGIRIKPGETSKEVEQLRYLCANSLHFLCTTFLGYKDWDLVHDEVEKFLMKPARKKALMLPRGHLKTSFVTIGYAIQQVLKNPNTRILIGNGVWDIARSFLSEIKAHLEQSQLKYIFSEFQSARWNADEIIVKQRTKALKEPSISTTGVEAETTGGHYDIIILDDLIGLQNSQTPEQREKVKRFRRSMINLLEPGGLLIEIGTRWHLDDTFSEIFEKEMRYYNVLVKKVYEADSTGRNRLIFPKHFAKKFDDVRKDWTVVDDPYCMDYVDHLKASMPLDEFSAQYFNEPFSSENQLFKPEMFQYWKQKPDHLFIGMAVDLAISEARSADETAIVVCGMDKDWKLYVLDYLKGRWKPSDLVENLFEFHERWRPHVVGMETNGFQRTLRLAVEDMMRVKRKYFYVEEIKTGPERSKETRIKTLEPFYRNGCVYHAAWMKGKDLETQLQTFPKGKHDDVADALSMTLPLLQPGIGFESQRIKEGSWEWWLNMAKENNSPHRRFFDQGSL